MKNNWKLNKVSVMWNAILSLMNHTFPVHDDYYISLWAMWEERVKNGHSKEEKWLQDRYMELEDSPYDSSDVLSDDYSQTVSLTNSMYATMVVSIWSEMESFLKRLVQMLYRIHGISQKVPYGFNRVKKLCADLTI